MNHAHGERRPVYDKAGWIGAASFSAYHDGRKVLRCRYDRELTETVRDEIISAGKCEMPVVHTAHWTTRKGQ
jgi:hypothetical protein